MNRYIPPYDQNCDVIALPQTIDKFESSKSYRRNSMIATLLRTTLVPISMILVNIIFIPNIVKFMNKSTVRDHIL